MTDKKGRTFRVRYLTPADRPALRAMYRDFEPKRAAQGLPPAGDAALDRWLDRVLATGTHLVVEVDDVLAGHAMLIPMEEEGAAELANFLHQSVRNRGIGTELNRIAVDLARDAGYRRVWLSVEPSNRAAVRSYEKAGFRLLPGFLWAPEVEMAVDLRPA
ncbi:MAG: GNAT family N-acetyltransferase [Gemmatimonadetes bacterium]|nr:GNAT family N-acetyltransferase [Gemmatimonadota bacterium]